MNARALLLIVTLAATACGTARRGEPIAGPFRSDDPAVRHGAALFDAHCDRCHTGGEAALGPSLNDKPLPSFVTRFQVRHGAGAMPAFSEAQIGDADLEAIVAYLRALRRHGG